MEGSLELPSIFGLILFPLFLLQETGIPDLEVLDRCNS
jgi:hypothetical protein